MNRLSVGLYRPCPECARMQRQVDELQEQVRRLTAEVNERIDDRIRGAEVRRREAAQDIWSKCLTDFLAALDLEIRLASEDATLWGLSGEAVMSRQEREATRLALAEWESHRARVQAIAELLGVFARRRIAEQCERVFEGCAVADALRHDDPHCLVE